MNELPSHPECILVPSSIGVPLQYFAVKSLVEVLAAPVPQDPPAFLRVQRYLIARFLHNMIDHSMINKSIAINSFRHHVSFLARPRTEKVPTLASIKTKCFTIVLSYHPVLIQCGLYTCVRETFAAWKPILSQVYGADISIRIAWCRFTRKTSILK